MAALSGYKRTSSGHARYGYFKFKHHFLPEYNPHPTTYCNTSFLSNYWRWHHYINNHSHSIWPPSLTSLHLGDEFDFNLDYLPPSLHELHLGSGFNQPIAHLPPCLVALRIGGVEGLFNQPVDHLPASLHHLVITSATFDHPLHRLPGSLKTLVISSSEYSQAVDQLPHSLTDLAIEAPVALLALPPNITMLRVHLDKQNTLAAILPSLHCITHLVVSAFIYRGSIPIPASVRELSIIGSCHADNIPPLLKRLTITNRKEDVRVLEVIPQITGSLTLLQLPDKFDAPLGNLPRRGLQAIILGGHFNHPLDNLPITITHIQINHQFLNPRINFNQAVDHLPPHLRSFVLMGFPSFNQKVDNLPNTLEEMRLCGIPTSRVTASRQPLHWRFGGVAPRKTSFDQSIKQLPANLRVLVVGDNFTKPVIALPPKLHTLVIFGEPRYVEVPAGAQVSFLRLPDI